MAALTRVLLEQTSDEGTFFNHTETLDDISILMDGRTYTTFMQLLPASLYGIQEGSDTFKVISVAEGDSDTMSSFAVTTGLVSAISDVLARSSISIFYVSTFQTDFVVLKSKQL